MGRTFRIWANKIRPKLVYLQINENIYEIHSKTNKSALITQKFGLRSNTMYSVRQLLNHVHVANRLHGTTFVCFVFCTHVYAECIDVREFFRGGFTAEINVIFVFRF